MVAVDEFPSLYPTLRKLVDPEQITLLSKATLVDLSHAIEDIVLEERLQAAVFTGFQKSSHWNEEVQRYAQLASVASNVCIFARDHCEIPEFVRCEGVTLAFDEQLSQEWFLLVLTRELSVVLCGKDCHSPTPIEAERLFETIWTFDPQQVAGCLQVIAQAVARYRPALLERIQADFETFRPVPPNPRYVTRFAQRLARSQERVNARLREANRLLEQRVDERTSALREALGDRESFFTQLQDLIYTLAHDVRTPLIATDLVLKRALEGFYGEPPAALRGLLEDIRRSDRQLVDLADNLLTIARLEAGVETQVLETVLLAPLVSEVLQDLAALAAEKQIQLDAQLQPLTAHANSAGLRRVLINLLDNAIKFSPVGGRIAVRIETDGARPVVAVQDEGPGMDLQERRQLFERFWQGRKRQLGKGTGLGLYLSSRLISAQGGTITVDSEPGQGSTFFVTLPPAAQLSP